MTVIIEPGASLFVDSAENLKTRIVALVDVAKNLAVHNEEGFKKITAMYAESKGWEKRIEELRKKFNAPDQERINGRNDKAKELLGPLKELQEVAKSKSENYQRILEAEKAAEEAAIASAISMLGENVPMPFIPPVDKSQRGDGAIAYTRIVKKWKVVDEALVPRKYLKIDEDAVDRDTKLGIATIPGLEIYEEKVTQLRCR